MNLRRVLAAGLAGALLVLEASVPATAAEPGHPSGTFTLHRTVAYLHEIDWEDGRFYGEEFYITATSLTDDETLAEDLTLEASPGDGQAFQPISLPCPPDPRAGTCAVYYDDPGTFTPQVRLTDEDGNSTVIDLPTVRVLRDSTPPVVRVTKPAKRKLHRVSAWRIVRGTVVDAGVGGTYRDDLPDGIYEISVQLLQKRGARWWYYAYDRRVGHAHWFRGLRTEAATFENLPRLAGEFMAYRVNGIHWHTRWIRGLKRGPLVVRAYAADWNSNATGFRKYSWVRLTQR